MRRILKGSSPAGSAKALGAIRTQAPRGSAVATNGLCHLEADDSLRKGLSEIDRCGQSLSEESPTATAPGSRIPRSGRNRRPL